MSHYFAPRDGAISKRELDHQALSRRVAGECPVLLENDGALPIPKGTKIALFGNGARQTIKGGTGSGDVNTRENVNIETGLEKAGYTITTKDWLNRHTDHRAKEKEDYLKWVEEEAEKEGITNFMVTFTHPLGMTVPAPIKEEDISSAGTDTAVYVIARNSGEGADRNDVRGDYYLYEEERDQIAYLAEKFEKLVVVLNVGGVIDLTELTAIQGVNAILLMGQLGNIGGDALADVISGDVTPSGKLTDTWAKKYSDYPSSETFSHNDGNIDDEYYTEGIYVGYRWFDTFGIEPLYPFGFGRSYTDFDVKVDNVFVVGSSVKLIASVENTGKTYAGKEVVQVYCSAPQTGLKKPYQVLAAYKKSSLLKPGEKEKLELSFDIREVASYCPKCAAWVVEAGEYIIRVGVSSRDTQIVAVVTVDDRVETYKLRNMFRDESPVKEIEAPEVVYNIDQSVPRLAMVASEIPSEKIEYQDERPLLTTEKTEKLTLDDVKSGQCTLEELVAQLTVKEMAELCVGTLRADEGSIVGNASYSVPGAAGDTSDIISESRGFRGLIMADGPAGLRLQPVFKTTKDGELLPGGEILGEIFQPFDPKYNEENSDTYYQYCTAIPIGWSLAQSWNIDSIRELGAMVGHEMELFGIDLWLAPAMNIHRNPLCGRNFEYFSEDPLVSGRTAGAVTSGVQSVPGRGVTIKHYAANNQEDNRYFTNSHVSERALREIYIRGFEIAVRETQPCSIMTSYNLLNGEHTANSKELIDSVARQEWGFKGLIMTDWYTSQNVPAFTGVFNSIYPISASTGCVYAGNDLQMPGCDRNVDDIIKAVSSGEEIDGYKITLADLQFCTLNVLKAVIYADQGK